MVNMIISSEFVAPNPIIIRRQKKMSNNNERRKEGGKKEEEEEEEKVRVIRRSDNGFVKHCVKLRLSSSYRHSHSSALLIGSTPIREVYNYCELNQDSATTVNCLIVLDKAEVPHGLNALPLTTVRVSSAVMKKLSGLESPDSLDAIALMKIPSTFSNLDGSLQEEDWCKLFPSLKRILVLDGIQDPGNLGTLLRSAMAFGWGGIFLLPGCCDPFNEKALRASRGASFQIPIVSGTWAHLQSLIEIFHFKILAGHPDRNEQSKLVIPLSQKLVDSLADRPLCLVLGSEGGGLSEKTRQLCELVSIHMAGEFESLNVSVAGGIFLYMLQSHRTSFFMKH